MALLLNRDFPKRALFEKNPRRLQRIFDFSRLTRRLFKLERLLNHDVEKHALIEKNMLWISIDGCHFDFGRLGYMNLNSEVKKT